MNEDAWSKLHTKYKAAEWQDKPSLFAQTAVQYFPKKGRVLELGAGLGQDSRFFAEQGYDVTATDLKPGELEQKYATWPKETQRNVHVQKLDLQQAWPLEDHAFDAVYAHLSIHYFTMDVTKKILDEIVRVLKPGGRVAFLLNSTSDPQYGTGKQLEPDYFYIDDKPKRFFSVDTARQFERVFQISMVDNLGETYKDSAKGVHNLIRFIGTLPAVMPYPFAIPCVGAIVQREHNGATEVLLQTRWKPGTDPQYSGTFEFPIGKLEDNYKDIFDELEREVSEESGLTIKRVLGTERTDIFRPQGNDAAQGFRPFYCTQQLKGGKPWISYIFICEAEAGEPKAEFSETRDPHWVRVDELRKLLQASPEKFFTLEIPALVYYCKQKEGNV